MDKRQINDPIHGLITLDNRLFHIIDTPIFQRLRNLKQLGGAYFVFPGASHNRFEHSIGTCYLAGKWMRDLKARTKEGGIITDEDIFQVEIAALCHDLGHGPFSHTFEDVFLKKYPEIQRKFPKFHERASGVLLKRILDTIPNKLGLSATDINNICCIINGKIPKKWPKNKLFMFEIVSNPTNSIDVDKFDYLARDCYAANLGLDASNVFTRLMQFSEIRKTGEGEERHICFSEKEEFNIHQLFSVRYSFHREVYSHPVIKAIEHMIGDILELAGNHFNIQAILEERSLARYATLTDTIIEEAERATAKDDLNLEEAKKLITRLRQRKLYKLACKVKIESNADTNEMITLINTALEGFPSAFSTAVSYNYALKNEHPLPKTWLYAADNEKAFIKSKDELSLMLPSAFLEKFIYVYSKDYSGADLLQITKRVKKVKNKAITLVTPSPKTKKAVSRQNSFGETTSPSKLPNGDLMPSSSEQENEEEQDDESEQPTKIRKTDQNLDAKDHASSKSLNANPQHSSFNGRQKHRKIAQPRFQF